MSLKFVEAAAVLLSWVDLWFDIHDVEGNF